MKKITVLVLMLMLLALLGCSSSSQSGNSTWVTYIEHSGQVKSADNTEIFVYSYRQPVLKGDAAGVHMINTKLDNATTAFLYGSGGVEEMTELAKMDWQESWFVCYALERSTDVARLDDTVVSFRYCDYVFNGGAHGNAYEYGMTYDMVSGEHLTLESITDDVEGLKLVCRQHILDVLASDDFAQKDQLMEGYEEHLDSVLKNWVFTYEGLQFIAQPYIISTYAMGTLRVTVPYSKISHVLHEKWIPAEQGHGGGTVAVTKVDGAEPAAVNFVTDDNGDNLVVKVNGKIYDFSVEEINSYKQRSIEQYYIVKQLLYSPEVSGESFGLQMQVPENGSSSLFRWRDGSGEEYQYLLTYDEKHGAMLTEAETAIRRD